jgi:hypothetical protein
MNFFKGVKSIDELLKSTEIKKMIVGISNLDNKNPNSLSYIIFENIVSHASIFSKVGQKNFKTGILIQYGKCEYFIFKIIYDEFKTIFNKYVFFIILQNLFLVYLFNNIIN